MVNAQEWLDQEYPKNDPCLGEYDKKNKTKRRQEITELKNDGVEGIPIKLEGKISLEGFIDLRVICFSNCSLTGLDMKDCKKIEELTIVHNKVDENLREEFFHDFIKKGNFRNLKVLNVSNNNFSEISLSEISNFTKLEKLVIGTDSEEMIGAGECNKFFGSLKHLKGLTGLKELDISYTNIDEGLKFLPESLENFSYRFSEKTEVKKIGKKLAPYEKEKGDKSLISNDEIKSRIAKYRKEKPIKIPFREQKYIEKVAKEEIFRNNPEKVRNILLIGNTGNGKSTVANVLINKNNNFEQFFKESNYSVSETKSFEKFLFKDENGIEYRIIDTVGFGDTKLTRKQSLLKVAQAVYEVREGIYQVLFLIGGRFTEEEIKAFESLKKAITESHITSYTTIVRTKFSKFKDLEECEKDKKMLIGEKKIIKEIIESCNGIIYVDNPSLEVEDEDEREIYKKKWKISREKLLEHLTSSELENKKAYKLYPKSWERIVLKVSNYLRIKKKLEENGDIERNVNSANAVEAIENEIEERLNSDNIITSFVESSKNLWQK